jgi:hypothetical protein
LPSICGLRRARPEAFGPVVAWGKLST